MREFVKSFAGSIAEMPTNYFKSKMDTEYGPQDTILQYLEHFNNLRKVEIPTH